MRIEFSDGTAQYHCDECRCITDEHGFGNHLARCSREKTHGHDATIAELRAQVARLQFELDTLRVEIAAFSSVTGYTIEALEDELAHYRQAEAVD